DRLCARLVGQPVALLHVLARGPVGDRGRLAGTTVDHYGNALEALELLERRHLLPLEVLERLVDPFRRKAGEPAESGPHGDLPSSPGIMARYPRLYQRGETLGGGPSATFATSTLGSPVAIWRARAAAKLAPRSSTVKERTPKLAASAAKSGVCRSTP